MAHCDTLISAPWCVTMDPPGALLEDHAVAITDGRIDAVLPQAEARDSFEAGRRVDRPGHVLLPGLINAHTHAAMSLFRGFGDDLPLEAWLKTRIWPAERQWVSAEFVRDGTALAIVEMLRSGTTCFSDQYFFPEVVARTAVDMQMRAVVATPVIQFPTAWAASPNEYLEKAASLVHDPYAEHPLVTTAFAPHSTYSLDDESFRALRIMADQLDVPVQIHLHETAREVGDAVGDTGMRPLERLRELGLVNRSLLAVHAVHVDDREIELMAGAGVAVAHCPRSNLKLASGIAPATALRSAGVTVAIGTDSPASNNVLDMFKELETAALVAKVATGDAAALTAADALAMATIDSARALGIADRTGSITRGKWADLITVDLTALNSQPVYDPVSQVVYTARSEQVADVWTAGRQRVDRGELLDIDADAVVSRANEWQQQIAANTPI